MNFSRLLKIEISVEMSYALMKIQNLRYRFLSRLVIYRIFFGSVVARGPKYLLF